LTRSGSHIRRVSLACLLLAAVLVAGFCEPFFVLCRAEGDVIVRRMCFVPCDVDEGVSGCHPTAQPSGPHESRGVTLTDPDAGPCCEHQPMSLPLSVTPAPARADGSLAIAPAQNPALAQIDDLLNPRRADPSVPGLPPHLTTLRTSILLL
jgi:hypothetical protein